ncbi:NAD(P)-dependent oxidoreductase [Galbitalea sp. SE-J8]|uniref:NAD(P)-dependent oxidoreductase n=1 Tax=Galbitalea sp. SE-J8 TaxID=3054952 RepID=UPI00259CCD90|nr:NAD(P)-dependent oxidoreductase [Galbitalea sp. SE-J8]MDM4763993.1 NAD(P)-dependent oxidoreductase [Galbitalea sp. SE-J8]
MASVDPALTRPRVADVTLRVTAFGCDADEAALLRALAPGLGVDAVIASASLDAAMNELTPEDRCISVSHHESITAHHLDALSAAGVRYISTRSIGTDHIDVVHAERVGIEVGNVSYSPGSVADYTLMLMLMTLRHARSMIRRTHEHDYRLHEERGRELGDLTVGVVGTGRIGSAVIDRLRGFGSRILTLDARRTGAPGEVPLDELLRVSDVITLHAPLTAETRHLLDAASIARMKADAIIVNTARGALIDTVALIEALEEGRLGGAALDVLEEETGLFYADHSGDHTSAPIETTLAGRLRDLPNVVLSPHSAYFTDHALRDMVGNSLNNCLEFDGRQRG